MGGHRKFYFGGSADTGGYRGFHLGKVTEFTQAGVIGTGSPCPPGLVCQRQGWAWGGPSHIWDGRGIETEQLYTPGDESGSPSEIRYAAVNNVASNCTYDRINPSAGSAPAADGPGMHNPYKRWLFSKKDENDNVTTYTRDSRRRVTRINHPDGSYEEYSYNEFNQVLTHRMPSGAVQHYEYDELHRLQREYNSVDYAISQSDYKFYTYYGPGNHPEWTDLVEMVVDGRARVSGAPFTTLTTYNGRQQVMSVEYPFTGGVTHPTVRYEYDKYGNRTAIIDELGHRKNFTYDNYRRCTSSSEQVGSSGDCNGVQVRRWDWIYDRVIDDGAGNLSDPPFRASTHTSKEWRIQIEPAFNDAGHRRATARTFDINNRIISEQTGLIQLPTEALGHNLQSSNDTETHSVTYDPNGQKSSSTDPLGRVTTYEYDNRNRLEKTTEPKRENQDHPVTRLEYDRGRETKQR